MGMFCLGCSIPNKAYVKFWITMSSFKKKNFGLLVGFIALHVVIPFAMSSMVTIATNVNDVFTQEELDFISLGVIIQASSPGTPLSNLLNIYFDGDPRLCLFMTAFSTISSIFSLPLNTWIWKNILGLHMAAKDVPYQNMMITSTLYLIYIMGGGSLNRTHPKIATKVKIAGVYGGFASIIVCIIVGFFTIPQMLLDAPAGVAKIAFFQPFVGFILGWCVTKFSRWWFNSKRITNQTCRTVALVCCMVNCQYNMALFTNSYSRYVQYFDKTIIYPLMLSFTQLIEFMIILMFYQIRNKTKVVTFNKQKFKERADNLKNLAEQEKQQADIIEFEEKITKHQNRENAKLLRQQVNTSNWGYNIGTGAMSNFNASRLQSKINSRRGSFKGIGSRRVSFSGEPMLATFKEETPQDINNIVNNNDFKIRSSVSINKLNDSSNSSKSYLNNLDEGYISKVDHLQAHLPKHLQKSFNKSLSKSNHSMLNISHMNPNIQEKFQSTVGSKVTTRAPSKRDSNVTDINRASGMTNVTNVTTGRASKQLLPSDSIMKRRRSSMVPLSKPALKIPEILTISASEHENSSDED